MQRLGQNSSPYRSEALAASRKRKHPAENSCAYAVALTHACRKDTLFREGLIWVEVNVPQSKEPLHFLLDSGASVSVLNLSTAQRLGLQLGPKVSVTAVATTLTGHWPVK